MTTECPDGAATSTDLTAPPRPYRRIGRVDDLAASIAIHRRRSVFTPVASFIGRRRLPHRPLGVTGERPRLDEAHHLGHFPLGLLPLQRLTVFEHFDGNEG